MAIYNQFTSVWLLIIFVTILISQSCLLAHNNNNNNNHNHNKNRDHNHHHHHHNNNNNNNNNNDNNNYNNTASLSINVLSERQIPKHLFGIFFEEINHAGAGGLWAELVSNTGFEAGGRHAPSMITPWGMIGHDKVISITTEMSSCFKNNPVALRMDIHCNPTTCPPGGVGIYNPGYWGMNIEEGKTYKVIFHVKSTGPLEVAISLQNEDGTDVLAFNHIVAEASKVKKWTKIETILKATASYAKARLQLTTAQNGTIWFDQISAMPTDTYKGHGFRMDLMKMLLNLKPRFLRFPGGCYVEGNLLSNAFRWKETVGPWEDRPGHFGDVWSYWSDDGLGYLEYLQLAEDLDAEPVWVINNGYSIKQAVDPSLLEPFIQEMLDSIEFARGSPESKWGSLRAKLGHPAPFSLKYIAIGNEECENQTYRDTYVESYNKFYKALKKAYPDIQAISNCDATKQELDHPADLYDFHRYTNVEDMLKNSHVFEKISRKNPHSPKAFVSEYAVIYPKEKVMNGTFRGALAEAAFLLSLEKNSDVVEMVSYAPLFVNQNDRNWNPDAIFFNSNKAYGIASYWVQIFFKQSSGALLLDTDLHVDQTGANIYATAIKWMDEKQQKSYITIKIVNFNSTTAKLNISFEGIDRNSIQLVKQTVLSSADLDGDNSFGNPTEVVPQTTIFGDKEKHVDQLEVEPYSFTAFDMIQ